MVSEEKALSLFSMINTRNLNNLEELLSEDCIFRFPGSNDFKGPHKIKQFFKILFRKFNKLEFKITEVISSPDRFAVVWTNYGTTPKNEIYANEGVTIIKACDNKIVSISDFFKDTSFFIN